MGNGLQAARQHHPIPPFVGHISSSNRSILSQAAFLLINSTAGAAAAKSAFEAPPLRGFRAFRRPLQRRSAPRPPVVRRQLEAAAARDRRSVRICKRDPLNCSSCSLDPDPSPLSPLSPR